MGAYVLHFWVLAVASWLNQSQQNAIEYLLEENRVLRQQLGKRRLRLTDAQRRRLAVRAKVLGRRALRAARSLPWSHLSGLYALVISEFRRAGRREDDAGGQAGRSEHRLASQHLVAVRPGWGPISNQFASAINGAITSATTLISFTKMFNDGPAVSNGSPTVSPTTAAL